MPGKVKKEALEGPPGGGGRECLFKAIKELLFINFINLGGFNCIIIVTNGSNSMNTVNNSDLSLTEHSPHPPDAFKGLLHPINIDIISNITVFKVTNISLKSPNTVITTNSATETHCSLHQKH